MTWFLYTGIACLASALLCHLGFKACERWLTWRRRTPRLVREGTPRDGGRGTLDPQDDLYPFSGHIERTAALGRGLMTPRPGMVVIIETVDVDGQHWNAMRDAQRPRETPEESMRRRNALGAQANYWNR